MSKRTKLIVIIVCVAIAACVIVTGAVLLARHLQDKQDEADFAKMLAEYYNNKCGEFAEQNAELVGVEVVFLGDSLTDGCNLATYYPTYQTANRGIGGDTTEGLKNRLAVSAYDVHPQVIVLLIGCNDINIGTSLDTVYANYREIIEGIRSHLPDTKIVWCSLTPLGKGWAGNNERVVTCNQRIKSMAEQYGCTYVDLFGPLYNEETGELYAAYTVEGVHFTDAGYQVVSGAVKKALADLLQR